MFFAATHLLFSTSAIFRLSLSMFKIFVIVFQKFDVITRDEHFCIDLDRFCSFLILVFFFISKNSSNMINFRTLPCLVKFVRFEIAV